MAAHKTVDSWMSRLELDQRPVAEAIRQLVLEADPDPDAIGAIKWGNPTYEKQGRVCYLAATKGYVSLGFFNGAGLTDHQGRIEVTGKKMRHVKVRALSGIDQQQFAAWIREAVALNQG